MRRRLSRTRRPLLALLALIVALVVGYGVKAADSGRSTPGPSASTSAAAGVGVALSTLPAQVSATVRIVRSGGPYPYPHNDGVVFHNYEHVLPREPDGWYHEYTVATPGSADRGARRLITGRDGAVFYTDDHYETFRRVDVGR